MSSAQFPSPERLPEYPTAESAKIEQGEVRLGLAKDILKIASFKFSAALQNKPVDPPSLDERSITLLTEEQITGDTKKAVGARQSISSGVKMPENKAMKHANVTRSLGDGLGSTVTERINVVATAKEMSTRQSDHLQGGSGTFLEDFRREYYNQKAKNISHTEAMQQPQIEEGAAWIGSNYFRDLIKISATYEDAVSKYTAIPVNMRRQIYTAEIDPLTFTPKGSIEFLRVGVVSDMTNGFTNLQEIKDIRATKDRRTPEQLNGQPLDDQMARNAKIDRKIEGLKELTKGKKNSGILKLIFGAYTPLKPKAREGVQYAIKEFQDMKLSSESFGSAADGVTPIQAIEEKRRLRLSDQLLQLVMAQVDSERSDLKDGSTFIMAQVGLLNPSKSKLDETGWMHDEKNEMTDFAEILKEFSGKEIIYDKKGPFVDKDGNLHIPPKDSGAEGRRATLKCSYFNISVTGKPLKGYQMGYFDMALYQLGLSSEQKEQLEGIRERIEKEEFGHDLAEDLVLALNKMGIKMSLGCLSAKDRTGIVSGGVVAKFALERATHIPKVKKQSIFERLMHKVLVEPDAVTTDNTGVGVLKLNPNNLSNKIRRGTKFTFALKAFLAHVLKYNGSGGKG